MQQATDFAASVGEVDSEMDDMYNIPVPLSDAERDNVEHLHDMLKDLAGGDEDCVTSIVAGAAADDLLVDFNGQEKEVYVPVHTEFDEPLVPYDYDAYGDAINW